MVNIFAMEIRWVFNAVTWKPTKQQILLALSGVSQEENERIQKFRFKEDYKLCLIGRLMIRKCVQTLSGISWKDIILSRSQKGKPELGNGDVGAKCFFNISHQGNYTVLAASTSVNVGIDIMKFVYPNNTDIPSFFKLMKRQFVDEEWKYINSFSSEWTKLKAFYRLWCLKESYVKALGTGIGTNSAEYMKFDVKTTSLEGCRKCTDSVLFLKAVREPWSFDECLLDEDHVVAVAIDTKELSRNVDFEFISFESLVEDLEVIEPPEMRWWEIYDEKYTKNK